MEKDKCLIAKGKCKVESDLENIARYLVWEKTGNEKGMQGAGVKRDRVETFKLLCRTCEYGRDRMKEILLKMAEATKNSGAARTIILEILKEVFEDGDRREDSVAMINVGAGAKVKTVVKGGGVYIIGDNEEQVDHPQEKIVIEEGVFERSRRARALKLPGNDEVTQDLTVDLEIPGQEEKEEEEGAKIAKIDLLKRPSAIPEKEGKKGKTTLPYPSERWRRLAKKED